MAWNGLYLTDKFLRKYGFRDTNSRARVLDWINVIQRDIGSYHAWPFLKIKLKKRLSVGSQEVDLSPMIPSKPTLSLQSGGSLTDAATVRAKVTFLIFDESGKEVNSIESEPSIASDAVTTANPQKTIRVSGLTAFTGDSSVKPTTIHRKIYLKIGDNPYYLAATVENNVDTEVDISSDPSTTYEPPSSSMVAFLSTEDPIIENSGIALYLNKHDDILKYDPNLSNGGTPQYYARIDNKKILVYPKVSEEITISYWVIKVPSEIFYDQDRPVQLDQSFHELLEAGVTWKMYEDKDQDGQESKKANYYQLRDQYKETYTKNNGHALTVRSVC